MAFSFLKKYTSIPLPAKAALWFTVCNFIVAGLGFITGPIFTRLLSPDEYGILTQFLTYEQIIVILGTWEIQVGAYQRGLFKYEDNWEQFSQSTIVLINGITIILFIIIVLFNRYVTAFTGMPIITLLLLLLYLVSYPAYTCWATRMRTQYKYRPIVSLSLLFASLNILIPLLSLLYFGRSATIKFNSTLITSIVFYSIFYFTTIAPRGVKFDWKLVKSQWLYMIAYEAPLVLHSLSYLVLGQADRVMIGKMVGDKEAAFYGVAYTLASAATILQNSLNQALIPWRYRKLKEEDYGLIGSTTNSLLILFGGAIMVLILIAPELMRMLFTKDYYESIWCIPPVSVSVFFMFLYSTFVSVETYYEKTKYVMYVSVICGAVNIILNYIFIPVWGYIACAYTTLASYVLFAILHYFSMKRVCKEAISNVTIFSLRRIVVISIALVLSSIGITLLYHYCIPRYLIALCLFILAFIYRRKLTQLKLQLK